MTTVPKASTPEVLSSGEGRFRGEHRHTLVLLRHAKSDHPSGVADHERPLSTRGIREAGLAGDWLRTHVPAIDAVLCSTATRTRQTLSQTLIDVPVNYVDRLYGASPSAVVNEINNVQSRFATPVQTLLVIGHEPAMSQVALSLAAHGGSNPPAVRAITAKFPTSGIAVLHAAKPWGQLTLHSATLTSFHVPR